MIARRRFLASSCALLLPGRADAQSSIAVMPFSSLKPGDTLPAWLKPYAFPNRPRHNAFDFVVDEGRTVLRARSADSTSGLVRELSVDLAATPWLAWRWKVMNLVSKSELARKSGDDFPARLYVTFDNHARALCYVWATGEEPGTIAPNPYSARVQMVVVDSGAARLGRWQAHERDVAADYRRAFKADPPAMSGVIVSADTDNTGESAESYFGDVSFRLRRSA